MKPAYNKYILTTVCLIITGVIIKLTSCEINSKWDEYYDNPDVTVGDNVLKLLSENSNYSMFYEALLETGYDSLLTKNQYFTVFAPSNAAFEGLPSYSSEDWRYIMGFHICYLSLFSRDFEDINIRSIIGKYLNITEDVPGGFKVFDASINMDNVDLDCQNGVIHEIDRILVPKQNIYEYINSLDDNFSLIKQYLNSMEIVYVDLDESARIGVDDNGNTIYDTVWARENYFLDKVAMLNTETQYYTTFLAPDEDILQAINNAEEYFGDISLLDDNSFNQLLSIAFSASFFNEIFRSNEFPDTMTAVTGKQIAPGDLDFYSDIDREMSNGIIHVLDAVNIPKEFFLYTIVIECDEKAGRSVSNTVYPIEVRSDSRASRGTYLFYDSKFVGDYIEFTVDMVLATKYWLEWTGPALGGSYYQLAVDNVNVGDSVECYYKGNFKPVLSGSHSFEKFGTKKVRMTMVNVKTLPGYNALYLDYIRLIPDELYNK